MTTQNKHIHPPRGSINQQDIPNHIDLTPFLKMPDEVNAANFHTQLGWGDRRWIVHDLFYKSQVVAVREGGSFFIC